MTVRVHVAGGLKDAGLWDAFARVIGERFATAGVAVSFPWSSAFGRHVLEGYLKVHAEPAPGLLRVHAGDGPCPSALEPFLLDKKDARMDRPDAPVWNADVVLLAGNGKGLHDIYWTAVRRGVPVVPFPIDRTTSEELWEESLRRSPRPFASEDLRAAFMGLRHPDPRAVKTAERLVELASGLGAAPDLPTGPSVLVVQASGEPTPGEDGFGAVLRRSLRAVAPGARLQDADPGWLGSPGKAMADAVLGAGLVIIDLAAGPAALYALGLVRGARRPVVAIVRAQAEAVGVDPRAVDAVVWRDEAHLAAMLDARLKRALRTPPPPVVAVPGIVPQKKRRKPRPRRRGPGGRRPDAGGRDPGGGSGAPDDAAQRSPAADDAKRKRRRRPRKKPDAKAAAKDPAQTKAAKSREASDAPSPDATKAKPDHQAGPAKADAPVDAAPKTESAPEKPAAKDDDAPK